MIPHMKAKVILIDVNKNLLKNSITKHKKTKKQNVIAQTYLQLPLRQWSAGIVYLLVLSSWKVNIAENPIAEWGL